MTSYAVLTAEEITAMERYRQCRFIPAKDKKAVIERVYADSLEPLQAFERDGRTLAYAFLRLYGPEQ